MKKLNGRKLGLNKETVRTLQGKEMEALNGGIPTLQLWFQPNKITIGCSQDVCTAFC